VRWDHDDDVQHHVPGRPGRCAGRAVRGTPATFGREDELSDTLDLVETLATAARDAVLARRKAIEAAGAGALRGITVEIEPANRGEVLTVETFLQWRQTIRGGK